MIFHVVATRFQLFSEVIDLSLIPTGCGFGAMVAVFAGALARLEPDRIARVVLLGNVLGGAGTAVFLLLGILGVFS